MLIIFDGIDGVGKTTQLHLVQQELEQGGYQTVVRRNLGGTPIGEALRLAMLKPVSRPPLTDIYISAAIQEALLEEIEADRASGSVILLDRGPLSLVAYQVFGSGADADIGWQFTQEGIKKLKPDLILIYETSPATAKRRLQAAGKKPDFFESKPQDYFERVSQGFKEAAQRYQAKIIDAEPEPDAVFANTMQLVRSALQAQASLNPHRTH